MVDEYGVPMLGFGNTGAEKHVDRSLNLADYYSSPPIKTNAKRLLMERAPRFILNPGSFAEKGVW